MARWSVSSVVAAQAYIDKRIQERTSAHVDVVNEQVKTLDAKRQGLRELVDDRAELTDKALTAAMASQQKALEAVAASTAKSFEGVNEWRRLVENMNRDAPSRAEMDAHWQSNATRISSLESRMDKEEGKGVGIRTDREIRSRTITILLAAAAVITTIVVAVVTIWLSTGR